MASTARNACGSDQPADGAVVERALQPLGRRGLAGGRRQGQHEPGQRAHPLGPHRVALVGHRRRADLLGLERLLELALVGQQPQVGAEPVRALGDPRQRGQHLGVDLARVGLARDGIGLGEAERLGHHPVERLDLGVVAVEELEEAGLRAGRPLDPQELQLGEPMLDLAQVEDQLVAPERRALADRHELGRLEVGVAQAGQRLVPLGELGQGVDRGDRLVADDLEGRADQDQVGVVGDVAARRAQVDDRPGHGRGVAQGVDVRHHVVPEPPLVPRGGVEVDRVDLRPAGRRSAPR